MEWFPNLPSYVAFIQRLNRFESLFPMLVELILKDFCESDIAQQIRLIDSMPIILANAKRSSRAKVANQFANKGYCSSKGIYYLWCQNPYLRSNEKVPFLCRNISASLQQVIMTCQHFTKLHIY